MKWVYLIFSYLMPMIIAFALAIMGKVWVDIPWYEIDVYGHPFKENLYAVFIFIILSIIYIMAIVGYIFSKAPEKQCGVYLKIFNCFVIISLFWFIMVFALEIDGYWWRMKFVSGEIWEIVCGLF